jgi:hypothetical protein
MNTPEEKKAWPPRGYVDRDRWLWINENCDPGDAARHCPVHFIPHNTFQLPSLIPMMSVAEHEATLSELKAECEEQARLNGMGQERELKLITQLTKAEAEILRLREALQAAHDLQDSDYVDTETPDGEVETWVNSNDLRMICEEALSRAEKIMRREG